MSDLSEWANYDGPNTLGLWKREAARRKLGLDRKSPYRQPWNGQTIPAQKAQPKPLQIIDAGELMQMEFPPRRFLFGDKIAADALYMGDGVSRAGKGMILGAALPVSLATGRGWPGWTPTTAGTSVIVTVEDTARRMQDRLRHLTQGLGAKPEELAGRLKLIVRPRGGIKLDDPSRVKELTDGIGQYKPDLIVLDNFHRMMSGSEIDDADVRAVMEAADLIREQSGAAVILIHHWGKSIEGKAGVHRSRGSSAIPGYVDGHLSVSRTEDIAVLEHHDGRDDEDWATRWTLRKEPGSWSFDVVPVTAEDTQAQTPRGKVLGALRQLGEGNVDAVAGATGISASAVRGHLKALAASGSIRIEERKDGKTRTKVYLPVTPTLTTTITETGTTRTHAHTPIGVCADVTPVPQTCEREILDY